jgi:hypothetical protein
MIDKNLKQYLDDFRFDPGLINLPIGATVIKRLRRMLGYHRYRDRTLWWTARREDLLTMVLSKFCEKHNCCIGAASQMRGKYRNEKQ